MDSILTLGFDTPEAVLLLGFPADASPPSGGSGPSTAFIDVEAVGVAILDVDATDAIYIDVEPFDDSPLQPDVAYIDVEPD